MLHARELLEVIPLSEVHLMSSEEDFTQNTKPKHKLKFHNTLLLAYSS